MLRILHIGEAGADGAPGVHSAEVIRFLRASGQQVTVWPSPVRAHHPLARLKQSLRQMPELRKRARQHHLVYARESWLNPFQAMALKGTGVALAVEVNGLLLDDLLRDGARAHTMALSRWCQGYLLRSASVVFVSCSAWARQLQRSYRLKAVQVIRNGVDLARFQPDQDSSWRELAGFDKSHVVLGFLGGLNRYHDFSPLLPALVEARKSYPQIRLLVGGSGPGLATLQANVRSSQLDDMTYFAGAVSHHQVPDFISAFDLALLPVSGYRLEQCQGVAHAMKVAEYCGLGKPILKADFVGSETFAEMENFSWSYQQNPVEPLMSALRERQLWKERGEAARRFAEQELGWDRAIAKIVASCEQILTTERRP